MPKRALVGPLEAELENAWRQRRWGSFLRAWITSIALTAAAGFLFPLVMIGFYTLIAMIFVRGDNRAPDILSVCASIAALAGGMTLIFTVPIMALKSLQGSPPPSEARPLP